MTPIPQGWAHATFGGSTGGWEALATQVFYPDDYNGAWVAWPDPVDFHAYQNVNLYEDTNAFERSGQFAHIPIAGDRKPDGTIIANMRPEYGYEYVLGTHGRSTDQWDIWQAVFSPAGPEATRNPHSDATFQYGPGMPHCYTGGPAEYTMQENNATWAQRVLPEMVQHMLATAPKGADTTSWRY